MQQASDSQVNITQLQLHCSAAQRPVVLDALDVADWPALPNHELLILRRLEVDAESWAIGHEAAAQVRAMLSSAANPWLPAAEDAQAVRFHSRADYVACLCREIVHPPLEPRWFWQTEPIAQRAIRATSAGRSLLMALTDEILLLPAVFDRLAQHDMLIDALRCLGADNLQTLIEQLLQQTGFALPANAIAPDASRPQADAAASTGAPQHGFQTWRRALQQLSPNVAQPAASLAALLLIWEGTPHALCNPLDAIRAAQGLRHRLLRTANETKAGSSFQKDRIRPAGPAPGRRQVTAESAMQTRDRPSPGSVTAKQGDSNDPATAIATQSEEPLGMSREHLFLTADGGFFYLLNLLRMAPMQAELMASGSSAWQHLYLLCTLLGEAIDMPLQEFLAAQLRLDNMGELSALRPGRHDTALLEIARKRLSHQSFWPSGLFHRPARVHHDEVQLDIDFHIRSVDLDIRLSGLDVDPGWLPWLGRIVRFHYIDDPTLLPGGLS